MARCACSNVATRRYQGDNVCDRCYDLDQTRERVALTNAERGQPVEDRHSRERGRDFLERYNVRLPATGGRHVSYDL